MAKYGTLNEVKEWDLEDFYKCIFLMDQQFINESLQQEGLENGNN
jgi:hypothetical protein